MSPIQKQQKFFLRKFIFFPFGVFLACHLVSCGSFQTLNSFYQDDIRYREITPITADTPPEEARFIGVQRIITGSCVRCHSSFGILTEAQWVSLGYVVEGSADTSLLFQRLRGSGAGEASKQNMPPDASNTEDEITSIRDWIDNLSL